MFLRVNVFCNFFVIFLFFDNCWVCFVFLLLFKMIVLFGFMEIKVGELGFFRFIMLLGWLIIFLFFVFKGIINGWCKLFEFEVLKIELLFVCDLCCFNLWCSLLFMVWEGLINWVLSVEGFRVKFWFFFKFGDGIILICFFEGMLFL